MACAASTDKSDDLPDESFDLAGAYELSPAVALRKEPFGALSYHYESRRLNFLRSNELVAVVESLGSHPSAAAALAACAVPDGRQPALGRALASLLRSDVIRAR